MVDNYTRLLVGLKNAVDGEIDCFLSAYERDLQIVRITSQMKVMEWYVFPLLLPESECHRIMRQDGGFIFEYGQLIWPELKVYDDHAIWQGEHLGEKLISSE